MPVFNIHYTTLHSHGIESLEWVTESSWDIKRTQDCFERRYPEAVLVDISEATTPTGYGCQHHRDDLCRAHGGHSSASAEC